MTRKEKYKELRDQLELESKRVESLVNNSYDEDYEIFNKTLRENQDDLFFTGEEAVKNGLNIDEILDRIII